jgi:pimeloyl-ACP methyl ester carboxylesterase
MIMDQAIEWRELITLDGDGVPVRGTFHKPNGNRPDPNVNTQKRIGIVFLNSLSLPRTATGDSAVYWAESLAGYGYPSFRLDLPGLGDSPGAIPTELLNFINAGGYASITSAKMKELVERFELSGVVIVGHCAGTVSAICAAAGCMETCKGLILMDPYFHLPQAVRAPVRRGLSEWALQNRLGAVLSNIYDRLRDLFLTLRGGRLPRNANVALLSQWREIAVTGLPILLLKAPARKAAGTKPRVGEFDYLKHVLSLAGRNSNVVVELVQGTDHSFANLVGRAAVRRFIKIWLASYLPMREQVSVAMLRSEAGDTKTYDGYRMDCLQG